MCLPVNPNAPVTTFRSGTRPLPRRGLGRGRIGLSHGRYGSYEDVTQPVWEISITTPSGPDHFISKLRGEPGAAMAVSNPSLELIDVPFAPSSLSQAASRSSTMKPIWWIPL